MNKLTVLLLATSYRQSLQTLVQLLETIVMTNCWHVRSRSKSSLVCNRRKMMTYNGLGSNNE